MDDGGREGGRQGGTEGAEWRKGGRGGEVREGIGDGGAEGWRADSAARERGEAK